MYVKRDVYVLEKEYGLTINICHPALVSHVGFFARFAISFCTAATGILEVTFVIHMFET